MSNDRFIVIMAGGRGERFWPASRLNRPKQLLPIVGKEPLLVQTLARLEGVVPPDRMFILTNCEQREQVLETCPWVPAGQVVGEPVGRDTAPAVALARLLVSRKSPNAAFAMLPADHVIRDITGYQSVLKTAFSIAEQQETLVTIGIQAEYPATGYGYIRKGASLQGEHGHPACSVAEFVEKPDRATAERYLASGQYYWNAGMFVWRADVLHQQLQKHAPGLADGIGRIESALAGGESLDSALETYYPDMEKISIDYALLEHADSVSVVESAFDWDDVGEWPAVARHYPKDDRGNVLDGHSVVESGSNNIVISHGDRLTAVLGADDLVVVQTEDATLVCPRSRAQEVKKLVARLDKDPETRPWV